MLKWCSYCQQFLGEVPDYHKLTITHGICGSCEPRALDFTGSDFKFAELLRDIQHQLQEAGRRNDLEAADAIIETAQGANIRTVDVLIGVLAPLLSEVGEGWSRNALSVADEHRFTSYCNAMFQRLAVKTKAAVDGAASPAPGVVLLNAPGNSHCLAVKILTLWLHSKGMTVRLIEEPPPLEELITLIVASRTRTVLISMALAEQFRDVASIVERVTHLPAAIRPRVVVGGYAVKVGMVSAMQGAELMGDISLL